MKTIDSGRSAFDAWVKPGEPRLWRVEAPNVPAKMITAPTADDAIEKLGELFPNKFKPEEARARAR